MNDQIGIVIIGRNEGKRLEDCIGRIVNQAHRVIYVDSGSSDGSVAYARSQGVDVLELDPTRPFSAARARNEGCMSLLGKYQDLDFLQFIDGDCLLCEGWLATAARYLADNPHYALVAGRRSERFPGKTIYNLLCDMEWDTPIGETESCGGDFMVRRDAFEKIGGFNPEVIAGEEPELCYRLHAQGWKIFRLDHPMTIHDANITRFSQWWMRAVRSGHAFAQGYMLHGREGRGYCVRDTLRIWFWAFFLPAVIVINSFIFQPFAYLFSMLYLVLFCKILFTTNKRLRDCKKSILYASFNILGKWAQLVGQIRFVSITLLRRRSSLIEYKNVDA
jgi:GT2 family glycosyltransferase